MKATSLILKNFAYIEAGMQRREITIDLSKSINQIIMLLGPNGSGKTSILSTIHPFAYNSVDDGKDDSTLILEGKDGYKEIIYQDGKHEYVIKHFYTCKGDRRTVKSYITKNGEELNENGNVRSFVECVKHHLGIEPGYLSILRLGSNVRSFIDKRYTERKEYASQLMSEIKDYLQFFKNASEQSRSIKNLMRNVTDKIAKLQIIDIETVNIEIENLEKRIESLEEVYNNINTEIGINQGKISSLYTGADINKELEDLIYHMEKLKKRVAEANNTINQYGNSENVKSEIDKLNIENSKLQNSISTDTAVIEFKQTSLGSLYTRKYDIQRNLSNISSDRDTKEIKELISNLRESVNINKSRFDDYKPLGTVDEYQFLLGICQQVEIQVQEVTANDKKLIKRVCRDVVMGADMSKTIQVNLAKLNDRIGYLEYRKSNLMKKPKDSDTVYIMMNPHDVCDNDCPYIQFYNDMNSSQPKSEAEKITEDLKLAEIRKEEYIKMDVMVQKINYIKMIVNSNKDIIHRLKANTFLSIRNILMNIQDDTLFYNEEEVTEEISKIEDFNDYNKTKLQIEEYSKELVFVEQNESAVNLFKDDLRNVETQITELEKELFELKDTNSENKDKLNTNKDRLEILENVMGDFKHIDELKKELNDINIEYEKLEKISSQITEIKSTINNLVGERGSTKYALSHYKEKIDDAKYRVRDFKKLQEEKDILEEKFEMVDNIREAVSNTKGIPLLFQELFLKNSRLIMNELLDIVYKGDLVIEEFIINEKEFRIPYRKMGLLIEDVASASQGEKAFISIALSFALMIQTIDKYNIILLDEMDSTLDTKSRKLFLDILEKQISKVNGEQVFLISHNNMFDNYPVDAIVTGDETIRSNSVNVIWKR